MATIRDLLTVKGRHTFTISAQATAFDAATLMNEHKIGSLMVLENGRLIGILTERDFLVSIVAGQRDANTTRVEDFMTRDVICCRPHTTIEEARSVMKHRRMRHLPVVSDDGDVVGLISIGDLNAHQADSQERTICQLQEYIYGYV